MSQLDRAKTIILSLTEQLTGGNSGILPDLKENQGIMFNLQIYGFHNGSEKSSSVLHEEWINSSMEEVEIIILSDRRVYFRVNKDARNNASISKIFTDTYGWVNTSNDPDTWKYGGLETLYSTAIRVWENSQSKAPESERGSYYSVVNVDFLGTKGLFKIIEVERINTKDTELDTIAKIKQLPFTITLT